MVDAYVIGKDIHVIISLQVRVGTFNIKTDVINTTINGRGGWSVGSTEGKTAIPHGRVTMIDRRGSAGGIRVEEPVELGHNALDSRNIGPGLHHLCRVQVEGDDRGLKVYVESVLFHTGAGDCRQGSQDCGICNNLFHIQSVIREHLCSRLR